ncbi:hypothetical protein [Mixta mediterraneensis]|uniref:hypothetical protein n=1 Tax=Mixta mediterraneensis TaxID=2758443 RepID=UPI001EED26FF|nr:hypothetical protein [Mixta mediterraneensis]
MLKSVGVLPVGAALRADGLIIVLAIFIVNSQGYYFIDKITIGLIVKDIYFFLTHIHNLQ